MILLGVVEVSGILYKYNKDTKMNWSEAVQYCEILLRNLTKCLPTWVAQVSDQTFRFLKYWTLFWEKPV